MDFEKFKKFTANTIKDVLNNYGNDEKKIIVNKVSFGEQNLDKKLSWANLQKEKNKNGTLSVPIFADISIKKGNKVISKESKLNIGQLPVVTKNNTVLVKGTEYVVPLQLRRDPGIYTAQSANGFWITSVNSSKGRNFKIENHPVTNVQKIEVDGTRIPLLPILQKLGFSKNDIIKAWGNDKDAKEIYDINEKAADSATGRKALQTLYKKLIYGARPNASEEEMKKQILDYMKNKTGFKPEVTKITLGSPYETMSPKTLLDISNKLINSNKSGKGDDTENLIFKHVKSPENLLSEKIKQDFKKKLTASLGRNLKNNNSVKDIVRPGLFTKTINSFFNESAISEPSEQINPLHVLSSTGKITIKGEGGITDEHTVSIDMKSLHPSHFGFIDPLHTPDGNAGLVNHLTTRVTIDRETEKIQTTYYDKSGKIVLKKVNEAWNSHVATPDQYIISPGKKPQPKSQKIKVMYQGENMMVSPNKVDLILSHPAQLFDLSTNLVPFINSSSGNRISMAGKHAEQAISLVNRETPNVSTITTVGGNKIEILKAIGDKTAIKSPVDGTVRKITKDFIEIRGKNGKIYKEDLRNNMNLNQESFYHDEPIVKIGEKVTTGQLLAKNNWTDDKGRLNLGANARVAYLPYQGYSIEDGIVISDSFAKKMTSQHLHVEEVNVKEGGLRFDRFKTQFRNKYNDEAFSKLDSNGLVKKGTRVEKGNILVAYAKPFIVSENDKSLGKAMKGFKNRLIDNSIIWNYDFPGEVVDVIKSGNLIKVKVKSLQPAEITDKLANRFGGKGIISKIVPDSEMPHTADGKPLDAILNPHGVITRINISQMFEGALGKIAEKTGKKYLIENFSQPNVHEFVTGELKKHSLSDTEKVIDPVTKKELKSWNPVTKKYDNPFVGNSYFQKLVHQTRKKFDARGRGAYSVIDMPGKDPEASHYIGDSASKENPKSIDRLTSYALLAHGAKDVINDMWNNKAQNRPEVWDAIVNGAPIPPPKVSTATKKLFDLMKAGGINAQRKGRFGVFPVLTDKDTLEMSNGVIPKPNQFLRGKDLMPIKGGMFDPKLTGGPNNSDLFAHIEMNSKVPNPIAKNAIMVLLNLTNEDFSSVLSGKKSIDGLTGIEFFEKKLGQINVTKEIEKIETLKKTAPKTKINDYNRKLRYLRALKSENLKPSDYLISKVPVIPTRFRPIIPLPTGSIEPAPINFLYRNIGMASKIAKDKVLPQFLKNEAIGEMYNQVSDFQGVTEPRNTNPKRKLKSITMELAGTGSPKGGFIHSKALAKTQDYIGSSVIAVGPELGVDEVGIPYQMAYQMYEPFVLRKLKANGYKITDYKTLKEKNPALIRSILDDVVKERPIIVNRNPSLHKGSIFAFNPSLIEGKSIKLNPLILKPLNADFDGDLQINTLLVYLPFGKSLKKYYNTISKTLKEKQMSARFNVTTQFINSFDEKTIKLLDADPESNNNFYTISLNDFPYNENEIIFKKDHRTFYSVPDGIKVVSYDETKKQYILADVKYYSVHEDREIWTVTTLNKRQIISDDDPRAVYGINPKEDLTLKRFYPKDSMGVMVPYAKSIEKLAKENEKIKTIKGFGKLNKEINLNKETGYVLGTLIGDGWYDYIDGKYKAVNLAGIEKTIIHQYENFLNKEIFINKVHIYHQIMKDSYGRSEKYVISSTDFAKWVAPKIGKGAKNKHLPTFWFNAPKEFKIGLLSGLLDTDGSICLTNGKKKQQLQINISSLSLRLLQETQQMLLSLGVSSKITFSKKTDAGNDFWILSISGVDIQNIKKELNIAHKKNIVALNSVIPDEKSASFIKTDLVPITSEILNYVKRFVNKDVTLTSIISQSKKKGYITRSSAKKIISLINKYDKPTISKYDSDKTVYNRPESWKDFVLIVRNKSISWSPVVEFENTGKKETGYDLTVPGYETFMSVDGTILSNTVIAHVPISQKAVEQAKTMIPSVNILNPKNDEFMIRFDQEYIAGLAIMTEKGRKMNFKFPTIKEAEEAYNANKIRINDMVNIGGKNISLGRAKLMEVLPKEFNYKGDTQITAKELNDIMKKMVDKGSISRYTDVVNKMKNLSIKYAYDEGYSFGLEDFKPRPDVRAKILNPAIPEILKGGKVNAEKVSVAAKKAQEILTKDAIKTHNRSYLPNKYGSKKISNDVLMQITTTPFFVAGTQDRAIKTPISKSYSEGLDVMDAFNASYGARKTIVDKVQSVAEPGALSKELVASFSGETITMEDCGTHNGITIPINDTFNLQGRVLAQPVNGVSANTILDKYGLNEIRKGNSKTVVIRSPLTCKAPKGVCAKCYGLNERGVLPALGDPIGIKAAQSIGETGTQSALSSHHLGGTVSAGSFRTGFQQTKFILHMPENVKNKSTLVEHAGVVKKIEKGIGNQHIIHVTNNPEPYLVTQKPVVKVNQKLNAGDKLDEGLVKLQELADLAPMGKVQEFMTNQLEQSYGGTKILRRNTETVVRSVTGYGKVIDPGHSPYLEDEVIPINFVNWIKEGNPIDVDDAIHWTLKRAAGDYPAGTQVTVDIANKLIKAGIKKVTVDGTGLKFKNQLIGINSIPLHQPDLLKRMSYQRIKGSLKEGPISGMHTNFHGRYPEPGLILGTEFGYGDQGKY